VILAYWIAVMAVMDVMAVMAVMAVMDVMAVMVVIASHTDLWCYMFLFLVFSNFRRDMAAATLHLSRPSYCRYTYSV
jgi:hypothetical protein